VPHYSKDSRLVFDFGMNNGNDTDFYLRRGFDVIALEANPALCEKAQARFQEAVSAGRLKIINAAISERPGEAPFFVNLDNDHWSSLAIGWAAREHSRSREIAVRCVTLKSLFEDFGVPHYLKIDVEGSDQIVIDQLRGNKLLPLYVSVEDCRFGYDYMRALTACGYDRFKLLDQSTVPGSTDPVTGYIFSAGSSGPFGDGVPGRWMRYDELIEVYAATVRNLSGERIAPRTHWWDIHCTTA
jgi:FkbM family methyltransferase